MKKQSALKQSLAAAAGKTVPLEPNPTTLPKTKQQSKDVLVGAFYAPEVRKALRFIEAESGLTLKQLLGRAINQLAVEYGKPEPYTDTDHRLRN